MSSFASVLVAKAKATPEKVVPYDCQTRLFCSGRSFTHEVYADNQLRLASVPTLNLSRTHMLTILTHLLWWRLLHLTVASTTVARRLLSHLRVCANVTSTGVNRRWVMRTRLTWWRHWGLWATGNAAGLITRRTTETALLLAHARGSKTGLGSVCGGRRRRGIRSGGGAVWSLSWA